MRAANRLLISGAAIIAAGCVSSDTPQQPDALGPLTLMSDVSAVSCPDGVPFVLPERIGLTATTHSWTDDPAEDVSSYYAPLAPVALYELHSDDPRFGGLSGMDFLDDDTLIIVSDDGSLIWIDVTGDTLQPADHAYMTSLRGADGQPLDGKTYADSEGVAWNGETLFISFERGHRVLGYDIEGCGANARGALVTDFWSGDFGEIGTVDENQGMEALAIRDTGELVIGVEARQLDGAPIGVFNSNEGSVSQRLAAPELTLLVGADYVGGNTDRLYALFRSYDPIRGNRIAIGVSTVTEDGTIGEMERLAMIGSDVTVDNFEGIAVQPVSPTTDRIVIVSDDNFSARQKTLLMVLDYTHSE